MTNAILAHLLHIATNSEASCADAAKYFGCILPADDPDSIFASAAFRALRQDQQASVRLFLTDRRFANALLRYLAYAATARIDLYHSCHRMDFLMEQYNSTAGIDSRVDPFRVFSFLDVVGDTLLLSENSPPLTCPPTWLSFLAAYAVSEGVSIWSIPGKRLAQILLKEVPSNVHISIFMLSWITDHQNLLCRDLLKFKGKRKQADIRTMVVQLLAHSRLEPAQIRNACTYLMADGISDEEMEILLRSHTAHTVRDFLRSEYGLKF